MIDLKKVVELEPDHLDAHLFIGDAYMEMKMYAKAVTSYSVYLEKESDAYSIFHKRGDAYFANKEYTKAMLDYNQALALQPDLGIVYNMRAQTKFQLNQAQEACADLILAKENGYSQGYHLLKNNCE